MLDSIGWRSSRRCNAADIVGTDQPLMMGSHRKHPSLPTDLYTGITQDHLQEQQNLHADIHCEQTDLSSLSEPVYTGTHVLLVATYMYWLLLPHVLTCRGGGVRASSPNAAARSTYTNRRWSGSAGGAAELDAQRHRQLPRLRAPRKTLRRSESTQVRHGCVSGGEPGLFA
eukprot:3387830-Rhodomonas_salina.1